MLGFAFGGLLAAQGLFRPITLWLAASGLFLPSPASLSALLGSSPMRVVMTTIVLIGTLLWLVPKPAHRTGWPWYTTGLALGLLGSLAWLAGAPSGWHWGLSITGPSRTLLGLLVDPANHPMTWGVFMLLGVPLGSWLSAWSKGIARWQMPDAAELPRRFFGGLLMGFGGTVAGGCNIGNALTGLSILSLNSLVATAGILLGLSLAVRGHRAGTGPPIRH